MASDYVPVSIVETVYIFDDQTPPRAVQSPPREAEHDSWTEEAAPGPLPPRAPFMPEEAEEEESIPGVFSLMDPENCLVIYKPSTDQEVRVEGIETLPVIQFLRSIPVGASMSFHDAVTAFGQYSARARPLSRTDDRVILYPAVVTDFRVFLTLAKLAGLVSLDIANTRFTRLRTAADPSVRTGFGLCDLSYRTPVRTTVGTGAGARDPPGAPKKSSLGKRKEREDDSEMMGLMRTKTVAGPSSASVDIPSRPVGRTGTLIAEDGPEDFTFKTPQRPVVVRKPVPAVPAAPSPQFHRLVSNPVNHLHEGITAYCGCCRKVFTSDWYDEVEKDRTFVVQCPHCKYLITVQSAART